MEREPFFKDIRSIKNVSFGVVTVFLYSFLLFNTGEFVPDGQQAYWNSVVLAYSVFLCLIIGVADARSRLFNVKLIDFLPRVVIFLIPSILVFGLLFGTVSPDAVNLSSILLGLPAWLFFIHTFMFVVIESTVQIWAEESTKLGRIGTSIVFGAMHIFVWLGPALLNFVLASLLFFFFSWINWKFRKNKNDLAPVIGVHSGYNVAQMVSSF